MDGRIKTRKASGTWVVRAGGAVLGESRNAVELSESGHPDVVYFPRADLAMAFLDRSDRTSHCPHKGDATYYHIQAKSGRIENAAWSYESPKEGLEAIAGHLAFYTDRVAVEQV